MPEQLTLEDAVDFLDRRQLRATYGAVATVVGRPATFLMSGIPRAPRYSWIVNQKTLLPTGYTDEAKHPALTRKSFVFRDERELLSWMSRDRAEIHGHRSQSTDNEIDTGSNNFETRA